MATRTEEPGLMDALVQLSFTVTAMLSQVGSAHDLSLTQLRVLAILRDHEPRMAELADHLGLDRSSISGLVDRAEGRGLVERFADPDDRRASRVRLTAEGRRFADRVAEELAGPVAGLARGLTAPERRTLRGLIRRCLP
jgi:DNA-binding MarR family transcriptional regulator